MDYHNARLRGIADAVKEYSPFSATVVLQAADEIDRLEADNALLVEERDRLRESTPAPQTHVRGALASAADALRPLADAVFNDNGDMTVNLFTPTSEECIQAYFAEKKIRAALATTEGKDNG